MPCDCTSYECLSIRYNPCSAGAMLNILATETGTWSALIEFNGVWLSQEFEVVDGEGVVVNNVFNPNYKHLLKLFNSEDNIVGCYKVDVIPVKNVTYTPAVSSGMQTYSLNTVIEGMQTAYANTNLIGAEILDITNDSINQVEGINFSFNTVTGTITFLTPVSEGQSIFILFKR